MRALAVTWAHEFAWLLKTRLELTLTSLPEVRTNYNS